MNTSRFNIYIYILSTIGYQFTYAINNHWDIIAADEISYLKFGKNLFSEVRFDWGFLYNLWYKFLSLFAPSTIDLYYLNYKVLIIGLPILLLICLVVYGIQPFIAFVISYLFLLSKLHITTWPFVSDFCICLILFCFILLKFIKEQGWQYIVLTFFFFLLYLTRPEFIIAFAPAAIIAFIKNKRHKLRWFYLLSMIFIIVLIGIKGTELKGIDRGFLAYAQHYLVTYIVWNKPVNFTAYDYFELAPKIFGKSFTLMGSIIHNPLEALRHIATCTGFYILNMTKAVEDFLLPSFLFQKIGKIKHLVFLILMLIAIRMLVKEKNKFTFNNVKNTLGIGAILFILATSIPNFLIGYSTHYLQLHFVILILGISFVLFKTQSYPINWAAKAICCTVFLIFTPSINTYNFPTADYKETKNLPIQKLAAFINKNNDHQPHFLISFQTNLHFIFDGSNFTSSDVFSIDKPFFEFIEKHKVDYIYINEQLLNDAKLSKDVQWKEFYSNPEKYNFHKQKINGTNNYLLIRKT